jgi:hypothetical protein
MFSISTVTDVEFTVLENSYFWLCLRFITERDIGIRINSKAIGVLVIFPNVCGKGVMSVPLTFNFRQWILAFKF